MNQRLRVLFPLIASFVLLTAIIAICALLYKDSGASYPVLMVANCLFFLVSLIAFGIQRRAMDNSNPNVFVRSVIKGVMLKMFICIAAVMAYVLLSGKYFNKPAVFISMVIYLVYLAVEVAIVMKLNKSKNA